MALAVRHLEDAVLEAGGAALRFGGLYGPGATTDQVELVRRRKFPLVGAGTGYCSWVPDKLGHVGPVADAWTVIREANQARRATQ